MINDDVSSKKHNICEKYYIRNPATCSYENGKYLASIIDDSRDYVRWSYRRSKNYSNKFSSEKSAWKRQNLYILIAFLLITIAFLKAVSV